MEPQAISPLWIYLQMLWLFHSHCCCIFQTSASDCSCCHWHQGGWRSVLGFLQLLSAPACGPASLNMWRSPHLEVSCPRDAPILFSVFNHINDTNITSPGLSSVSNSLKISRLLWVISKSCFNFFTWSSVSLPLMAVSFLSFAILFNNPLSLWPI